MTAEIKTIGDDVLRVVSTEIDVIDDTIEELYE